MIETNRFYIRKFNINDVNQMFDNWTSDDEVTKYLTWYTHENIDVTKEYINFVINTNQTNFVIVTKDTNEVIGSIASGDDSADYTTCELGYCLSRKYWNQGVMTEVVDAYLHELFINKNYQVVLAKHMIDNPASGKVMIKCGFRYNYTNYYEFKKFGKVLVKQYSITKEEYLMRKLQKEIVDFLDNDIPLFNNKKELTNYLSNNGYLVKTFNLIEANNINIKESKDIYTITESNQNIVKLTFVSNKNTEFENYVNEFTKVNKNLIINDNNNSIEQEVVTLLKKNNLTISFAESCTGGLMASRIINISGASDVINESLVTYSNDSKVKYLYVKKATIEKYSVYSKEVAYEMAKGLSIISKANVCVSITGLAGSNIPNDNDGSYNSCIIVNYKNKEYVYEIYKNEKGSRNDVRTKQANYIFYKIIQILNEIC